MSRFLPSLCLSLALTAAAGAQRAPDPAGVRLSQQDGTSRLALPGEADFHATTAAVQNLRRIDVGGSSVVLVLWDEVGAGTSVPHYAISLDGRDVDVVRPASHTLRLEHGAFDPLVEAPQPLDARLRAAPGSEVWLVQFVTQPLEVYHRGLESLGARVHAYVADHAYAVTMDAPTRALVEELPYVRWVGPYHPAYRVERFVRNNLGASSLLQPAATYNVMLFEAGAESRQAVADAIAALGGTVDLADAGPWLLRAVLSPEQVVAVAHLDRVQYVDRWGPPESDMNIALQFSGGQLAHLNGWTGMGVAGEVMDVSMLLTHGDFNPAPIVHGAFVSGGSHGTSTYGIVFGDGTSCRLGTMPDGTGIYSDADSLNTTSRWNHTAQLVNPAGAYRAVFQSNSWGGPRTTLYTSTSANLDQVILDHDFLIFQSQSNAGTQASRPEAWAKNVMAVGGINHFNTNNPADDQWSGASIGPASDGRIKPDLAHFYDAIGTTTSGSTTACTTSFGGTSGATPITAGHTALLYEIWHSGVLGNTPAATVFDSRPHFTLIKAMAIAGSSQWAFSGTADNLTRVHQGWGRVNLKNIINNVGDLFWVNETDVLENLESTSYEIVVSPSAIKLQATLTWADLPGNPAVQAQHRVNDLDLRLTSPSGDVYHGNFGLDAANFSPIGGEANTVDTVENVILSGPEPGTWTVEVIASELNADGHPETPALDADYALVVVGGSELVPCAPAQLAMRNGGANPVSYTSTPPVLGGVMSATVDLSTTGHDQALIFGFDTQTSILLSGGQTLLALDTMGSGEAFGLSPESGPLASFSIAVPNDVVLCGLPIASQAIHFGGVVPFTLSNGLDLTIGN